jgi:RND family efflux transporter MFP subunit
VIILLAGGIGWQLMANSPKAKRESVVPQPPLVTTMQAAPQDIRIPVYTQGTAQPRTSINLSAEVSGRVLKTAPQFADGGFFNKGDLLLKIDPRDYQLAITKAEAQIAGAQQQLAQAEAEYKQKLKEYDGVDRSKVTDYALRKPQYEEARARLKAAKADLEIAKLQLARCEIRAPFDGRVVEKKADMGQYVTPGTALATVYAVDTAEIRLPLSQSQADMLDLPLEPEGASPLQVKIRGQYAGRNHSWVGEIVRTNAKIDERNRLLYVIAQVKDPYGMRESSDNDPPLAMGMFVEAEIPGRLMQDVYILPRSAVHKMTNVWLLDEALRLHVQPVKVLHRGESHVYISEGLKPGDKVITSPLDAVVDGMQLRVSAASVDGE